MAIENFYCLKSDFISALSFTLFSFIKTKHIDDIVDLIIAYENWLDDKLFIDGDYVVVLNRLQLKFYTSHEVFSTMPEFDVLDELICDSSVFHQKFFRILTNEIAYTK